MRGDNLIVVRAELIYKTKQCYDLEFSNELFDKVDSGDFIRKFV